ncbi:MAG: ABC transporter ATP-binding protein [Eubacteriaceae bacterium]|nr:ABC transporter ATP-binding protein [Eubacteriaceae bacterium]
MGRGGPGGPGGRGGGRRDPRQAMEDMNYKFNPKVFGRIFTYMKGRYILMTLFVFFTIVANTYCRLRGTWFTGQLIDNYIAKKDLAGLPHAMIEIAIIHLAEIVIQLSQQLVMNRLTQGITKDIRDDLFTHMQTLPIKYFDQHSTGNIMSRFTNDVDTVSRVIQSTLTQVFSTLLTLFSVLGSMLLISIPLTGMVFVFVILMGVFSTKIGGKSARYFFGRQIAVGNVNGYIEEHVTGQKVVKVFNYEERAKKEFDKENNELFRVSDKANLFSNVLMPINGLLGNIQYIVLALLGAIMAIKGGSFNFTIAGRHVLQLGELITFLSLSRQFTMPLTQISMQVNTVVQSMAGAQRIFTIMDEKPEEDDGTITLVNVTKAEDGTLTECAERTEHWAWKIPNEDGTVELRELKGDIKLNNVYFGYDPEKTVLHDISIYAKPGQKIALVGATGAGKTTITNLINRFYDIQSGEILYDGINIKDIKKKDLRGSMSIVLQDTDLFTGTVMENIRYGKLDATDEECIEAAKVANAHGFIERLTDGYDTMLDSNGTNLSQGQRQLLTIARAAVADPPVMILDEATSSIDTRTEALVQNGMDKLMEGRTVFVIAHRLSTVQNSDAIMVIDQGKIIERGDHNTLIDQKGVYYQLYTGAFELE